MDKSMEKSKTGMKTFNPKASIKRAEKVKAQRPKWAIVTSSGLVTWENRMERIAIIRKGLPYDAILLSIMIYLL
jgi:hypothetical protein